MSQIRIFDFPKNIASDVNGFEFLSQISLTTWKDQDGFIFFNFIGNEHFEANLCSPLGALIDGLKSRSNKVLFYGLDEEIERLFKNNGFYNHVNNTYSKEDFTNRNLEYKKFHLNDTAAFQLYINESLIYRKEFPRMSDLLSKKINKSILEIFNNAHLHGKCDFIYTCGQYFPKEEKLKFSISDLGKTIRKNVNDFFSSGNKINGKDSIEWAVIEGNTTKQDEIPGGLGLSLIRDFLTLNEGSIQIISSDGYWEERNGITFGTSFTNRFLGTIVNFEFNLNDKKTYILASEIDPNSIF